MRFQTLITAGLALVAASACGAPERPTLLRGALYHGFTLVDAGAQALTPEAWLVVADGQIQGQGAGAPPSGVYIAIVDLSGFYALPEGGADMSFSSTNPLTDLSGGAEAVLVMTGGVLSNAAQSRTSLNEGADISSPVHIDMETL